LERVRIVNDVDGLAVVIGRGGPEVVLEATYGWSWAVDALREQDARVHVAHPLGVEAFEYRRVKNDERDAADLADLADLLRMGGCPRRGSRHRPRGSCASWCGTAPSWSHVLQLGEQVDYQGIIADAEDGKRDQVGKALIYLHVSKGRARHIAASLSAQIKAARAKDDHK
jgi:hypothetical protein